MGKERQKPSVANCVQSHLCERDGSVHRMTMNSFQSKEYIGLFSVYTSVLHACAHIYTTEHKQKPSCVFM